MAIGDEKQRDLDCRFRVVFAPMCIRLVTRQQQSAEFEFSEDEGADSDSSTRRIRHLVFDSDGIDDGPGPRCCVRVYGNF